MRRTLATAAWLLGAAVALSACGAIKNQISPVASKAQPLTLALDAPANATQAGIYVAQSDGALTRAGITLHMTTAASTEQALADVASGRADVAITSEPEVMFARNRHTKVLSFGANTRPS
jgi:ABC-type nitrate/sulfonate/bicarbonate transport system substrate-binding protein